MKKLIALLIFAFFDCAYGKTPPEIFAAYDFTKLDPQEISINFQRIAITVWDRCEQCDCPEPLVAEVKQLEEIENVAYRKSYGVVSGPLTIKGSKQEDGAVLFSRKIDDCKIDSITTYIEDHKADIPCDPNCAEPAKVKDVNHHIDFDGNGCQSNGSSNSNLFILLLTAIVGLLLKKKKVLCERF